MHWTKHRRGNRNLTDPLFQVCGLARGGSGQDARVSEARLEQAADDEEEEDGCNDGDGQGEVTGKEGAAVKRKEKKNALLPTIATEPAISCGLAHYELPQGGGLTHFCVAETSGTATASPENTGITLGRQHLWHKDGSTSPCTQALCPSEVPESCFKNLSAAPKLGHLLQQQRQEHMEKHPELSRNQNQHECDPIWSNT